MTAKPDRRTRAFCPPTPGPRPTALAPAVSHRLLYRLRREIGLVAACLAAVAGFANAVVLRLTAVPAGYLSGSTTRVTVDAISHSAIDLWVLVGVIGAFVFGAAIAGAIAGTDELRPGGRYAALLCIEGVLLLAAAWALMHSHPAAGVAATACALGLQNGMANGFYGVIVRTTHLSGIFTDIGVLLGHIVRRQAVPRSRLLFLGGIVVGFVAGSAGGALAGAFIGGAALVVPAVACLAGGSIYWWRFAR